MQSVPSRQVYVLSVEGSNPSVRSKFKTDFHQNKERAKIMHDEEPYKHRPAPTFLSYGLPTLIADICVGLMVIAGIIAYAEF